MDKDDYKTSLSDEEIEILRTRSDNEDPTLTNEDTIELLKATIRNCYELQELGKNHLNRFKE